jgi:hypothetical protein
MDPLPKDPLETTAPSKAEALFGKIPLLGWMIARILEARRFHPIEVAYMSQLNARDYDEVIGKWHQDQRADAARLMTILAEEFGWTTPHFMPSDPCLVAFWAHEDGLDYLAAFKRIEDEWGIQFTDEELFDTYKVSLLDLVHLIQTKKANKTLHPTAGNAPV